jgi:PIN domain nuclease of toxin-antitoxin system
MSRQRLDLLPLLPHHVVAMAALPVYDDHKDPLDHQLIGQAIAEDIP